jgi:CheY-like chemotaxis protein
MCAESPPRVLLAEENLSYRRVMREALNAFRVCEVDDAATGEHAFELALKRRYSLFIFAFCLPDISGEMLDRLLAKAYPKVHADCHAAPPMIFLLKPEDGNEWQRLSRNARARSHVLLPPRLDMLMNATSGILPKKGMF